MPPSRRSAFTLVELLVVVGIIGVLVAIVIGVAASVAEGGRARATEGVLRALDQSLDIFVEQRGGIPDALIAAPPGRLENAPPDRQVVLPLVDGVTQDTDNEWMHIPSVGVYLLIAEEIPQIQSLLAELDPSQIVRTQASFPGARVEMTTIIDAWGNPIRMVHPRFHGVITSNGQFAGEDLGANNNVFVTQQEWNRFRDFLPAFDLIRRLAPTREEWAELTPAEIEQHFAGAVGDSDGGLCPTPRPYFYSAGPDGDPATIDDNVYTTRPRFPEARN